MSQVTPIRRRVAPSYPLTLELEDDGGGRLIKNFRLSFDFNAFARIEELTGIKMLGLRVWTQLSAKVLGVMLWAAVLAKHPEYHTVDDDGKETPIGIEAIRSYVDAGNVNQVAEALWEAYLLNLPKDKAALLRELKAAEDRGEQLPNVTTPADPTPPSADPTPPSADGSSSGPLPDMISASVTMSSAA